MTPTISSIWIIGLSSAGKTTLARKLVDRLSSIGKPCILIDGNEVRDLFDKKLDYDPQSRRKQTERIRKLTHWISRNGIIPIVAIIHPFEDDRRKCRGDLPGYYEIYLDCDLKTLELRDNKGLYAPARRGEKKHVVGIDIPYEPPQDTDMVVNTAHSTADEILDFVWSKVSALLQEEAA